MLAPDEPSGTSFDREAEIICPLGAVADDEPVFGTDDAFPWEKSSETSGVGAARACCFDAAASSPLLMASRKWVCG
jgi:hypothetical protein